MKINLFKIQNLLLITFIILVLPLFGQTKQNTLSEKKISELSCSYYQSIDIDKNDTNNYIYLSFQNAKYQAITDIKSILFNRKYNKEEIIEFINNLKTAQKEMGLKQNITWTKNKYKISLYDFSNDLYLSENKYDGYTKIKKHNVELLINWLESIVSNNYKNVYQNQTYLFGSVYYTTDKLSVLSKYKGSIEITSNQVTLITDFGYGNKTEYKYNFIKHSDNVIFITTGDNIDKIIINKNESGKKKGFEYNCVITFETKEATNYYYCKID